MAMLGERIPAEKAEQWGMIWQVVDDEALMETAFATARKLAAGPNIALGLMRKGFYESAQLSLTDTLAMESRHQQITSRTADNHEAIAAMLEKRAPVFKDR
jgi:2-(1,2-epoxy-1,2-dihydrophenyl)acetyl-CoA isomerase